MVAPTSGQVTKNSTPMAPGSEGAPAILGIAPPGATIGKGTEWIVSGTNLARRGVAHLGRRRESGRSRIVWRDDKLKVEVDPKADPGYREVRAVGPTGISNLAW